MAVTRAPACSELLVLATPPMLVCVEVGAGTPDVKGISPLESVLAPLKAGAVVDVLGVVSLPDVALGFRTLFASRLARSLIFKPR
jgi:hypothetical protein